MFDDGEEIASVPLSQIVPLLPLRCVQKDLVLFVVYGLTMTKMEIERYASRGSIESLITDYFRGIKNAKDIFLRDGKEGLKKYLYDERP